MRIEGIISQTLNQKNLNILFMPDIEGLSKYDEIEVVSLKISLYEEGENRDMYKARNLSSTFNQVAANITKTTTTIMENIQIEKPQGLQIAEYSMKYATRKVGQLRADWQMVMNGSKNPPDKDVYTSALFLFENDKFTKFNEAKIRWERIPFIGKMEEY